MKRIAWIRSIFILAMVASAINPAMAREGDTLNPITIDAPMLETWPENLLNQNDERALNQRINEARISGVPLAVRIVDISQPEMDIPFQVRQFLREDQNLPVSEDTEADIAQAWITAEPIESSEGANDGFLLLVLVPEDRTQTQAMWWIGPNALPINGLTEENILATHDVMDEQFAKGNMPNGVFVGLLEFSYNVQFGIPERLERSDLLDALHLATIPMAIGTALAGISIPILALWLSRKRGGPSDSAIDLSPWEAAALHLGRARARIPAAMLLDSVHRGEITPLSSGDIQLASGVTNPVIDSLRPFANEEGGVDTSTMYEIESITQPVREQIEASLQERGAMSDRIVPDRTFILLVMGITAFLVALTTVPSVKSMSAIGAGGICIGVVGIGVGWWWLAYRRYTTQYGDTLLAKWIETASAADRSAFDLAVQQDLLTDQDGGPTSSSQTMLVRQLRGLGPT